MTLATMALLPVLALGIIQAAGMHMLLLLLAFFGKLCINFLTRLPLATWLLLAQMFKKLHLYSRTYKENFHSLLNIYVNHESFLPQKFFVYGRSISLC